MAVWPSSVTDLAADPSQSPDEIVTDADSETGVSGSIQHGVGGETELGAGESGGTVVDPHYGFSGAFSQVDDATFVPDANNVGAASQFVPGQKFSSGFLNEKSVELGHVTEGNDTVQNPMAGVSDDVGNLP